MYVITTERLPIKVWGEQPDEATLQQARNLANLPFATGWIALLPDAHVGYGMPIGGVLAARGQVIPHAVGLDIGCGVRAWRTGVPLEDFLPLRDQVLSDVHRSIPTGFDRHGSSQEERTNLFDDVPAAPVLRGEIDKAKRQVGTLGGGNHFIEIQKDPDDIVWVMIHSGSRNLGKQMAEHYDRAAKEENRRWSSPVPEEWGLAHLAADSRKGEEYLDVMGFCLRFARENRRLMQETVQAAFDRRFAGAVPDREVDVHHNYAAIETHLGEELVVHRKGAVRAEGPVVIPGSMGTRSFLGRGLANEEAFESCSHGAGRRLGRRAAVRSIPIQDVLDDLKAKDIRLFKRKKGDVAEEASAAYKDIDAVMGQQKDLVEAGIALFPVGVVKA